MSRTRILALLLAGALGAALPVGCGASSRENVERSNKGQEVPRGTPEETVSGPTQLTPTGKSQPEVTQPQSTSPTAP